jgi:hypothetical protein
VSAQSSSTAEAFVKTFKRDYCVVGRPDAVSVLRQLNSDSSIATACIRTRVWAIAREFR